jgi:c-di-AMP phosphodiesterase-like protein
MKTVDFITEMIAWLQIAVSPIIISIILAVVVYYYNQDRIGLILSILILLAGIITGVIWATRIYRKRGTVNFMAKVSGSPELDKEN